MMKLYPNLRYLNINIFFKHSGANNARSNPKKRSIATDQVPVLSAILNKMGLIITRLTFMFLNGRPFDSLSSLLKLKGMNLDKWTMSKPFNRLLLTTKS
eukprot:15365194-Ditylum_brightwellii.AAC.1